MARWLSCAFFWLLLAALPTTGRANEPRPTVVLTLGDSITKGVRPGVTAEQTFSAIAEKDLAAKGHTVRVINVGIGGENSEQALARLEKTLFDHRPDIVAIMYGTNDSYVDKGQSAERIIPARFRANLEAIVASVRRSGGDPILTTEPRYAQQSPVNGIGEHCNVRLEPYAAITRDAAEKLGTPVIDHFRAWTEAESAGTNLRDWTTDGYHPNPAGHAEMAGRLVETVDRILRRKPLPGWPAGRTAVGLLEWESLKIPGASVFRQPGSLYLVFDQPTATREVVLPRLNNVVLRAWWWPIPQGGAVSPAEMPAEPTSLPWTPPVERLLKFSQSPTEWRIAAGEALAAPAVVVLDVVGVPRLAAEGERIGPGRDGVLTLNASDAIVHGDKLQFEPLTHKNTVGYWVNPADWVEWKIDLPAPSAYRVQILQGCGGHAGSEMIVSVGNRELVFDVEETGHFQNFRWREIGTLGLEAGSAQSLELRCRKLAKGAVMDVRQIRLVPTGPQPASRTVWDVAPDVVLPPLTQEPPAPGRRCLMRIDGEPNAYFTVTFPTDWNPAKKFPVVAEWTGNGPYANPQGDRSTGRVEDGELALGLAGTDGAICVGLPYLDQQGANVTQWWGSAPDHQPATTVAYAKRVLDEVCGRWAGDPDRIVLVGFSRGAIACNALGLHDDEIAKRWRGMVCFSHYDGVRTWPVAGSDRTSALTRLARLQGRPQFLLAESSPVAGASLDAVRTMLTEANVDTGRMTFAETGFVNHDDAWALRPSPIRAQVRAWLNDVLK